MNGEGTQEEGDIVSPLSIMAKVALDGANMCRFTSV